ncbi:hypothetical protein SHKM778_82650 [Streptomyces sp. KM77-8]|uniref:Uncharacterized protein n=1 Tax=Streptomyces haneummycinicus TaxID=3074435 RepID=A0AAT9HWX4_9ACTN
MQGLLRGDLDVGHDPADGHRAAAPVGRPEAGGRVRGCTGVGLVPLCYAVARCEPPESGFAPVAVAFAVDAAAVSGVVSGVALSSTERRSAGRSPGARSVTRQVLWR